MEDGAELEVSRRRKEEFMAAIQNIWRKIFRWTYTDVNFVNPGFFLRVDNLRPPKKIYAGEVAPAYFPLKLNLTYDRPNGPFTWSINLNSVQKYYYIH